MDSWHGVALFALVFAAFIYFLFFLPTPPPVLPTETPAATSSCSDGETQSCTVEGCGGERACLNGRWSGCNVPQVCPPGSRASCVENACVVGYRLCNECGSAYGECIRNDHNF
ncbi:MAG TPA: hypothetical protein VJH24_02050 [Candidatus Bilamarchaeaceae archaeon]|nr:hypothetical protein [Candidatus Bilamarchaeaceae archaeon]